MGRELDEKKNHDKIIYIVTRLWNLQKVNNRRRKLRFSKSEMTLVGRKPSGESFETDKQHLRPYWTAVTLDGTVRKAQAISHVYKLE